MNTGFDEFTNYMNSYQFDIKGLSETWLSPLYEDNFFTISEYNFIRKDRNGRGGGIGFYIRNRIKFKQIPFDLNYLGLEYISTTCQINSKKILITTIYRSPSSDVENFFGNLDDIFAVTVPSCDVIIFMGDWNIDLLDNSLLKRKLETLFNIYSINNRAN